MICAKRDKGLPSKSVSPLLVLTLMFLLTAPFATAQPVAQPCELLFHHESDRTLVRLSVNGQPLPPNAILDWVLLAGERSYTHMISVTQAPEGLLIGPSATAEVGSYLLVVNTTYGPVHISIKTPLSKHKSIIETKADALGVGTEVIREQLGVSQRIRRENISLNLLPTYYTGDMLEIDLPRSNASPCVWKINGMCILEGQGQYKLRHPLTVPGPLEVVYEEWDGSTRLASAKGRTQVLKKPAIQFESAVNATTVFRGPANYGNYSWYVENDLCCHQSSIQRVFDTPGVYHVMCVSSNPLVKGLKDTREDVYEVTVR